MNTKNYRLREFINPGDRRSIIVDSSGGLSRGPLPGLECYSETVTPILPLVDGLVASPGKSLKLSGRTRHDAALLVRADWTNALRDSEFVLPPESIRYVPLLMPEEALDLGASAIVLYFLLGHEEEIEAACLRQTVQAALAGCQIGMPLIVDVQPIGPRVVLRSKAVELGVSYAFEGGADGVAVPWPGEESFETILTMASEAPVWIKPSSLENAQSELASGITKGGTGLWLNEELFSHPKGVQILSSINAQIHQSESLEKG